MTDDYAALVARLRDIADRVDAGDVFEIHGSTGLREAANVIEWLDPDAERNSWRHSEIRKLQVRVRELEAVEEAARILVDAVIEWRDRPMSSFIPATPFDALRAALREKGAER